MIDPTVLQQLDGYRVKFENARPFHHIVIDNFLVSDKAEKLLEDFPPFDPENAKNEFGQIGRKATVPDIRKISPFYAEVYDYIASPVFLESISRMTGIPGLIHDEFMFGGGTHENLEGQELDPHVDFNFLDGPKLHRRLNLLLYLNKEWEQNWGGSLELHSNPRRPKEDQVEVIVPVFNRCAIFETSEHSWHGFECIRLPGNRKHISRKLLSIYLYTQDRPGKDVVPPHSTFYVQRPLPAHFAPNRILTQDDIDALERLLAGRNTWIEYYQEKEMQTARALHDAHRYTESLMDAVRIPLTGYARQEGRVRGFCADGWLCSPFEVTMRLDRPVESIIIRGILPQHPSGEVDLIVLINGSERWHHTVRPGAVSIEISAELVAGEVLLLRIESEKSYCPANVEGSTDPRSLMMLLREISVQHAKPQKTLMKWFRGR